MKRFIAISDTHGKHDDLTRDLTAILDQDTILLHAGDVSNVGKPHEVADFLNWFSFLPCKYKIFIAGNHDYWFEKNFDIAPVFKERGVIYLMDNMVEVEGFKIYGSPWQPWFYDWAFNVKRGPAIAEKWAPIPAGLDILMTHGPAFGILDDCMDGQRVGCVDLLAKVLEVKPRYHICGHIHYAYGMVIKEDTTFLNASSLGERYTYINKPIQFSL